MKKQNLSTFVILLFAVLHSNAQCYMSFSALRPVTHGQAMSTEQISGMEFNVVCDTLNSFKKPGHFPFYIQLGENMYYNWLGKQEVGDIPLDSPQTGNAGVRMRNDMGGANFMVRFSRPLRPGSSIIPFCDISCGYRFVASHMIITPYRHTDGYEDQTRTVVGISSGINFGMGAGINFMLGKDAGIVTEVNWSNSKVPGNMVDLTTVKKSGSYLEFCTHQTPWNILNFKVGLVVKINKRAQYPEHYVPLTDNSGSDGGGNGNSNYSNDNYSNNTNTGSGHMSSDDSGSGCGFFSGLFSGCLGGGGSSNSNSSSSNSNSNSGNNTGSSKPNVVKIKSCCGDK
jgi:hypothetical protein